MYKKLLLLLVSISFTGVFAQHTIHGKMTPAQRYSWTILYRLDGVNQKYITDAIIKDGEFTLKVPAGSPPGIYRVLYDNTKNMYIDVLYNNEDVALEFHPEHPAEVVKFTKSDDNKLYQDYLNSSSLMHNSLDSLQIAFFQVKKEDKKKIKILHEVYEEKLIKANAIQRAYEAKSMGKLASPFIKAGNRFHSKEMIADTKAYMYKLKAHYFDFIDFNDSDLIKSSLLIDSVMEFVLFLNTSNDPKMLLDLRKNAIASAVAKISNLNLKKDVLESLIFTFSKKENIKLVNHILKEYYNKLPATVQDSKFKTKINEMLRTSVGQQAPDIVWKDNNLYNLKGHDYYLVVFWSTTCPHCLKELPKLKKYLASKADVKLKVIAIGLETNESKWDWTDEIEYYKDFIHVMGENKFKNKYVRDYSVDSTPNFFLLDADKKIINKPYEVINLQEYFDSGK